MFLAQKYKTREGADKRARFETAHSLAHTYQSIRFHRTFVDTQPFDRGRFLRGEYSWRVQRTHRARSSQYG